MRRESYPYPYPYPYSYPHSYTCSYPNPTLTLTRAMKDKRYADVLALFDEMLATYKEGTKPDLEVVDAVLESKALTAGVPAALQMLSLLSARFPGNTLTPIP